MLELRSLLTSGSMETEGLEKELCSSSSWKMAERDHARERRGQGLSAAVCNGNLCSLLNSHNAEQKKTEASCKAIRGDVRCSGRSVPHAMLFSGLRMGSLRHQIKHMSCLGHAEFHSALEGYDI